MEMTLKKENALSTSILPARIIPEWTRLIAKEEWFLFHKALSCLQQAKIPFVLSGAFGLAHYTGRLRNTKDLDLCILPSDRDRAMDCLLSSGFQDYFSKLPYDRQWIYRSYQKDLILDLIWAMANQRAQVDESWFHSASTTQIQGTEAQVLPPEYILWMKLYVLQKDRSDWLDLINLLFASVEKFDWDLLIEKVDDDLPLLTGFMQIFDWICPHRAQIIPSTVRNQFQLPWKKSSTEDFIPSRVQLLDSRPWFAALQPADKLLQI
jgi:hypothetical protein